MCHAISCEDSFFAQTFKLQRVSDFALVKLSSFVCDFAISDLRKSFTSITYNINIHIQLQTYMIKIHTYISIYMHYTCIYIRVFGEYGPSRTNRMRKRDFFEHTQTVNLCD